MTARVKGREPAGAEERARLALSAAARALYDQGLLTLRGGNLSMLLPGWSRILITPSGLPKGTLQPSDMVVVGRDGRQVDPGPPDLKPSIETPVHAAVYRARPDARAVVHAHPLHATAVATLGLAIEPVTVELAAYSRVPALPWLPPGSPALARRVAEALLDAALVLLAGHGAFAIGPSLDAAVAEMVGLERACQSYLLIRQYGAGVSLPLIPSEERGDSASDTGYGEEASACEHHTGSARLGGQPEAGRRKPGDAVQAS